MTFTDTKYICISFLTFGCPIIVCVQYSYYIWRNQKATKSESPSLFQGGERGSPQGGDKKAEAPEGIGRPDGLSQNGRRPITLMRCWGSAPAPPRTMVQQDHVVTWSGWTQKSWRNSLGKWPILDRAIFPNFQNMWKPRWNDSSENPHSSKMIKLIYHFRPRKILDD